MTTAADWREVVRRVCQQQKVSIEWNVMGGNSHASIVIRAAGVRVGIPYRTILDVQNPSELERVMISGIETARKYGSPPFVLEGTRG